MTAGNDNADASPLVVEFRPGMRRRIAAAVDALVALLDQIDGDVDDEEDNPPEDDAPCEDVGDDEPSLGATTAISQQHAWAASRVIDPVDEGEPSLGWTGHGRGHPEIAMRGYDDDRECDEERELDPAEDGIGDMDGFIEQSMRYRESAV